MRGESAAAKAPILLVHYSLFGVRLCDLRTYYGDNGKQLLIRHLRCVVGSSPAALAIAVAAALARVSRFGVALRPGSAGAAMPPDIAAGEEVWEGGGRRYRTEKVVGNGASALFGVLREGFFRVVAIKKVVLDRRYHNRDRDDERARPRMCHQTAPQF